MSQTAVHYWARQSMAAAVERWDPDAAPQLFASGVGHGLLELFVRMRQRGEPVSIGTRIPRDARVVVAHANTVNSSTFHAVRLLVAARDRQIVLIRGDVPLRWNLAGPVDVEVMPNRTSCTESHQVWLPLLPQRGLVPRDGQRFGRVRTVALKSNPENVSARFRSPEWAAALRAADLEWVLDVPTLTDGSDNHWHDFSDVDVSICYRDDVLEGDTLRKPSTRLVNAWAAGCIPIVGREPAYLELVQEGEDALVVTTTDECLDALRRLAIEPELVAKLESGGATRASEFTVERVLDRWQALFAERASIPSAPGVAIRRTISAATEATRAVVRRSRRLLRERRRGRA